jgi:hypothetical protein
MLTRLRRQLAGAGEVLTDATVTLTNDLDGTEYA